MSATDAKGREMFTISDEIMAEPAQWRPTGKAEETAAAAATNERS